jgi:Mg2+/citrate symporter
MDNSLIFDLVVSSILFLSVLGTLIALIVYYKKLDKQDEERNPA